ncbi:MAG: STAS domain-containing protein [Acidimicrobiia bacterium]
MATRDGPGDWKILQIRGEIDLSTADRVEARFDEMIEAGQHHLIADLSEVAFMDSTGVSVLAKVLRRVRDQEGELTVVCRKGPVRMVLAASGLEPELAVSEDMPLASE